MDNNEIQLWSFMVKILKKIIQQIKQKFPLFLLLSEEHYNYGN